MRDGRIRFLLDNRPPSVGIRAETGIERDVGEERDVDLTGTTTAALDMQGRFEIEAEYDYLYVQASIDGGATWTSLDGTVGARSLPTDIAYGWGVWRGIRRHRTLLPVIPRLLAWPPRPTRRHYGRSA